MAVAAGKFVGVNGNSNSLFGRKDVEDRKLWPKRNVRAMASVSCGKLRQEYKLLRLKPDAGEKDVKKAYRRLALQYHPDVCKGENCGATFHKINEAYQIVMSTLMEVTKEEESYADEGYMGFDEWEEWMGFEGGCATRDYSNHINYYT